MERPFAHNDLDQSPFETDGGSFRRPELSKAAGHIIARGESSVQTERRPHVRGAEALIAAAMGQEEAPVNHNRQASSWHRIEMSEDGKALGLDEQNYGQEFYAQTNVEQNSITSDSSQPRPATATPQPPYQPPAAVQPANPVPASVPASPVATPQQYAQPVMPQAYTTPPAAASAQPVAQTPAVPAMPAAVSPAPTTPRIAPGASATVDLQHRLPAPHRVKRVLTSPWTWLFVGVAMIVYFLI